MNYYEIYFKYNEENKSPEGYSIFFESEYLADTDTTIIELAIQQKVLDENDIADLEYIEYAQQISKDEYLNACKI